MNINAKTQTTCLIGHPVKQSFSPYIHNYLFNKYNINHIYTCYDIEKDNLESAIGAIKSLGFIGSNITIPYKVESIKYIDILDEKASQIGAINTIKNENSKLIGYSTDGIGFCKSILDNDHQIENKNILIIGAGGACRSICVELASKGAKTIEIRNRTIENAKEIKIIIESNYNTKVYCSTEKIDKQTLNTKDIIINTTPIGMQTKEMPIDENIKIDTKLLVCDIVYKPHETSFLKWAKLNNLDVVYGIDMLINQAIESFYIWTGKKATLEDVENIKQIYKDYIGGVSEI